MNVQILFSLSWVFLFELQLQIGKAQPKRERVCVWLWVCKTFNFYCKSLPHADSLLVQWHLCKHFLSNGTKHKQTH